MDETRRRKVKYLERCSFRPGSYEKRFVRDMHGRPDEETLTIRQAHFIDVLYWKYRKQIGAMKGDDKPEIFQPGELMVDDGFSYSSVERRESKADKRAAEAQAKLEDWNLRVGTFMEGVEIERRKYNGWPGPFARIVSAFEDKLWEAGIDS